MFSIYHQVLDNFECLVVSHPATGPLASIVPAAGATLRSWMPAAAAGLNVIDFYNNSDNLAEKITAEGFKSAKLNPFAGRLQNGKFVMDNTAYTTGKFYLGAHALHGLIYDVPYQVIDEHCTEDAASITLAYQYPGNIAGFPFAFTCQVAYGFSQNEITISTTISNNYHLSMPMQDGWHPYFTLGNQVNNWQISINASEKFVLNRELLPTGNRQQTPLLHTPAPIGGQHFDDCFVVADPTLPACTLRHAQSGLQLQVSLLQNYPYLQVYTPAHRQSIALEPMSAPPNAFNNGIGLKIIPPGEKITFSCLFALSQQ
jgi:aldose 1-epimerase